MTELEQHLGDWYRAVVMGEGDKTAVHDRFVQALGKSPALKAEARKLLSTLTDPITDRCYISRVQRDILERVIPLGERL